MKKAEVIEELQRVANLLETKSISRSSYQRHGTISSGAVEKTFGSWNEAIQAAGLTPLPQGGMPKEERRRIERVADPPTAGWGSGRISDDELLDDLLRLAKELGRRPSGNQIAAKRSTSRACISVAGDQLQRRMRLHARGNPVEFVQGRMIGIPRFSRLDTCRRARGQWACFARTAIYSRLRAAC